MGVECRGVYFFVPFLSSGCRSWRRRTRSIFVSKQLIGIILHRPQHLEDVCIAFCIAFDFSSLNRDSPSVGALSHRKATATQDTPRPRTQGKIIPWPPTATHETVVTPHKDSLYHSVSPQPSRDHTLCCGYRSGRPLGAESCLSRTRWRVGSGQCQPCETVRLDSTCSAPLRRTIWECPMSRHMQQ